MGQAWVGNGNHGAEVQGRKAEGVVVVEREIVAGSRT